MHVFKKIILNTNIQGLVDANQNVRINIFESKSILNIHKQHELIFTNIDSYKFLELFFCNSPVDIAHAKDLPIEP